jgi:hypothetical protein
MHLKQIVNSLRSTYKKIDVRLVTVKGKGRFEIAFLKIIFSKEETLNKKDLSLFNSFSTDLQFIRRILDVSDSDILIDNLQNGILELEENSYAISSEERNFLEKNFEIPNLYSKWASDLYAKEDGLDSFPLLLVRAPFSSTCNGILLSYGIPTKIKGIETSKLIHSFLDSSSINSTNSRVVILLPIYCMLKQILSGFDLIAHNQLVNQISVRILNAHPKSFQLSAIINNKSSKVIAYHVQDDLIKEGSEISIYIDSLDLELDKKEILHLSLGTIELPKAVQYSSKEDVRVLIERDESKCFERKLYLTYDPRTKAENKGKEFDVMKAIDSFLNTKVAY